MQENYLNIQDGLNSWKRYLSSLLLLGALEGVGEIIEIFAGGWYVEHDNSPVSFFDFDNMENIYSNPFTKFIFDSVPNVFLMIAAPFVIWLIHERSILTFVNPGKKIEWKKIGWGFSIFLLLLSITTFCNYLIFPSDYQVNPINFIDFIKMFLLVLFFIPIQSIVEEILNRGFLIQFMSLSINNVIKLVLWVGPVTGLCFVNEQVWLYNPIFTCLSLILTGITLTYITVKMDGLEVAIGARMAINTFYSLFLAMGFIHYDSLPTLFSVRNIYTKMTLIWTIIALTVFLLLTLKKYNRKLPVNSGKEEVFNYGSAKS